MKFSEKCSPRWPQSASAPASLARSSSSGLRISLKMPPGLLSTRPAGSHSSWLQEKTMHMVDMAKWMRFNHSEINSLWIEGAS